MSDTVDTDAIRECWVTDYLITQVEARNLIDHLCDALDATRAERDRLRDHPLTIHDDHELCERERDRLTAELAQANADLAKYGGHTDACRQRPLDDWNAWMQGSMTEPCPRVTCLPDCGWDALPASDPTGGRR